MVVKPIWQKGNKMAKYRIYGMKDEVVYLKFANGERHRIAFDENGIAITDNKEVADFYKYGTGDLKKYGLGTVVEEITE